MGCRSQKVTHESRKAERSKSQKKERRLPLSWYNISSLFIIIIKQIIMAKQTNNRYQKAASKKAMLNQLSSRLDTKGDLKHSALETGKDLLIGVLGGGLVAALIGKHAFVIGLGVTGVGHYAGNTLASTFGLGMM